MAWGDNFNVIDNMEIPSDGNKVWKFSLEEHRTKGTLQINIREFSNSETYAGPTKNGIIKRISSLEELEEFQKSFNDFVDKAKNML
jgi:hypothetical protein